VPYEDYWENDYGEPDYDELAAEPERDYKIDQAKEKLKGFFSQHNRDIFYMKQLEVRHEKQFFHWITANATNELIDEGVLGHAMVPLEGPTRVKFVFDRTHRYYKRQIRRSLEVIRQYANHNISWACGRQAEMLFLHGLTITRFVVGGQNTNEYQGKEWTDTGHNLDFILERDNISYGCEVKNTFGYIDHKELRIKLDICDFLQIKPLFIMRQSPKTYNYEIIQRGGFALIFEVQIYPFGQRKLVRKIKEVLEMPVDSPRAIPEGVIKRFVSWHDKQTSL